MDKLSVHFLMEKQDIRLVLAGLQQALNGVVNLSSSDCPLILFDRSIIASKGIEKAVTCPLLFQNAESNDSSLAGIWMFRIPHVFAAIFVFAVYIRLCLVPTSWQERCKGGTSSFAQRCPLWCS